MAANGAARSCWRWNGRGAGHGFVDVFNLDGTGKAIFVTSTLSGGVHTIQVAYNGDPNFNTSNSSLMNYTVNKAGDFWATGTMTGTVTAVPLDPSNPSFTGRFTTWFGESDNKQNFVDHSTFSLRLTDSDGSTITAHETVHLSSSASGLTVGFDKFRCG